MELTTLADVRDLVEKRLPAQYRHRATWWHVSIGAFGIEQMAALPAVITDIALAALVTWGRQDKLAPAAHARILETKLSRSRTILLARQMRSSSST
jgi:hypothetical protein